MADLLQIRSVEHYKPQSSPLPGDYMSLYRHKHIEKELHKQCLAELGLAALNKDDCVTPDLMTSCLRRLLEYQHQLGSLRQTMLYITNYYSVMSDGQICIPWDFKL